MSILPPPPPPPGSYRMKPIAELKARAVAALANQAHSYYHDAVDFAVVVLQYTTMVDELIELRQKHINAMVRLRLLSVTIEVLASDATLPKDRAALIADLLEVSRQKL